MALASRRHVEALVQRNAVAYGVTTGFGKLSEIAIPRDRLAELQGKHRDLRSEPENEGEDGREYEGAE